MPILYSIVESPEHPKFSDLYAACGITELRWSSMRKAIHGLKENPPDLVVAEFFYGYGNNYAGANLGNLDVFLSSLQKYAPNARVVVMVTKDEYQYASKLSEKFPIFAILEHPVNAEALVPLLTQLS